tara:strand:+ start:442 stop:594 length:153 start_codon:yes stop_codon:yes gene_type:complete
MTLYDPLTLEQAISDIREDIITELNNSLLESDKSFDEKIDNPFFFNSAHH